MDMIPSKDLLFPYTYRQAAHNLIHIEVQRNLRAFYMPT